MKALALLEKKCKTIITNTSPPKKIKAPALLEMNLKQSLQTPTPWMEAPQLLEMNKIIPSFQTSPPQNG
jgi:hypothetical protein